MDNFNNNTINGDINIINIILINNDVCRKQHIDKCKSSNENSSLIPDPNFPKPEMWKMY